MESEMNVLIRGGLVVRANGVERADLLVSDGVIQAVESNIDAPSGALVVDAEGAWVGPSFVDVHTHLREPGGESAETIESGARAALRGGYGAVVAMPNTEPALDSVPLVRYVLDQGRRAAIDVAVAGAITVGRLGEKLAPMAEMAALGVRLFTDDGNVVQDASLMRRALQYAAPLGVRLAQHCEDEHLVRDGVVNEGPWSARLGLRGRPALAEEIIVQRDIALVRDTGCPVHFMHLSSASSIAFVEAARREGLPVTCEVTPHHVSLDESCVASYDANFKVNPPLRSERDVEALREALRDGRIDVVGTDHAPHADEAKDRSFDEAPAGMLGLEHAAALIHEVLGETEESASRFFEVLSRKPAKIAQLDVEQPGSSLSAHGGDLRVGEVANLVVFDPSDTWRVDRMQLMSIAKNTPYHGRQLRGRSRSVLVRGVPALLNGELQ